MFVSPLGEVVGPLPNGLKHGLINWGDPNHLEVLGWSSKLSHEKKNIFRYTGWSMEILIMVYEIIPT